MPSKFKDVSFACAKCGASISHRFWVKISADDDPKLKSQIMDTSLFSSVCVKCQTPVDVIQDLRYSDYSKGMNFFVYLCPKENLAQSYEFIQTLPMLRSNGTKVHVVNTVSVLQTLIASYDLGLSPQETHIDQSVDSAKFAEGLNRQIDEFYASMQKGELPPGLQTLAMKKKDPWYKRLFGAG